MSEPTRADIDPLRLALVVLRCQAGDEQAFARLHEWFATRTLAYLRSMVADDAEDVQQEVWLAVYRQVAQLASPAAFRTWLFRTARHKAIDALRKRRREREVMVEGLDAAGIETVADTRDEPDARLDLEELRQLIARLPALHREALQLRYGDGMSYGEIAVVTGCPVGTVRSRLFNGRKQLEQLNAAQAERERRDASPRGDTP